MLEAIAREKQIKGGSRRKKLALIEATNAGWRDLYEELARSLRHCERSEATQGRLRLPLGCFAALAMTRDEVS